MTDAETPAKVRALAVLRQQSGLTEREILALLRDLGVGRSPLGERHHEQCPRRIDPIQVCGCPEGWPKSAPLSSEHGTRRTPCICPGCLATVPLCWETHMCLPCAREDCEHGEE
jgi:hypothetical protein